MSEKEKKFRNHLSVMQTHALVEELKKPDTQLLIDEMKCDRVTFSKHLSAALGFTITRGNLYEIAKTLGLKFHHPNAGIRPGQRSLPFEEVVAVTPASRVEIAELKGQVLKMARALGRLEGDAAAAFALKDDVKEYGTRVYTVSDNMTTAVGGLRDRVIDMISSLGKLETRVVRQADRLGEVLDRLDRVEQVAITLGGPLPELNARKPGLTPATDSK